MARKQDTRTVKAGAKKPERTKAAKSAGKGAAKKVAAKAKAAARPDGRKPAPVAVRKAVSAATSPPKGAKKAMKRARAEAKAMIAGLPVPHLSMPSVPSQVSDSVKAIGNQITSWLNTDLGRVLVAELLVYVAKQLTDTAAKTASAKGAKRAAVNAGAQIGAVAADAGAKAVQSGKSVTQAGAAIVESGRADADKLVRNVAQAAVGAVGEMVAEVAQKAVARRSGGKGKQKG